MSASKGQIRYDNFINLVKRAYPTLTKQKQVQKGQDLWKRVRNDQAEFEKWTVELKALAAKAASKSIQYWSTTLTSPPKSKAVSLPDKAQEQSKTTPEIEMTVCVDLTDTSNPASNKGGKYFHQINLSVNMH